MLIGPGRGERLCGLGVLTGLVFLAASCGGSSSSSAPILQVRADQLLVPNAVGSPGSQISMMSAFEFALEGRLTELGGRAKAYVIVPTAPSTEQLARLAAVFGVNTPFVPRSGESGGGLMAGPTDGTAPMISVMDDVMQVWSYAPAWADSDLQECLDTPLIEGTGEVSSACAPTNPPENLPTFDEAREMFLALLSEIDIPVDQLVIEVIGDEWGVTVSGYKRIDGVRSPFTWSTTYGENGSIVSAYGVFNDAVEEIGEYPRLSTDEALTRLRSEQSTAGSTEAVPEGPSVATLTGVEEELYILYGAQGEVYLVPGYTFLGTLESDAYVLRFIVSALPDQFLERVASTGDETRTSPGEGSTVPSSEVSGGEIPEEIPLEEANELLGLTESQATSEAESRGWTVRIAARDGEQFALTMDYSPTRVNLTIDNDVVTYLFIG